jgi:hypothetical protein
MIDFAAAALLLAAPVPAVTAAHGVPGEPLICASGGLQAAATIDIPPGTTRISGLARRTVARPGGRRIPGVTAGFQLRIGLLDGRRGTVAGMFLESGSAAPGPPQVANHFFGTFGRHRNGAPYESAQSLPGIFPFVIAPGDTIRFSFEVAPDGALRGRASWEGGEGAREAGGLVPAAGAWPTQLLVQCEVDDFAIEGLSLS